MCRLWRLRCRRTNNKHGKRWGEWNSFWKGLPIKLLFLAIYHISHSHAYLSSLYFKRDGPRFHAYIKNELRWYALFSQSLPIGAWNSVLNGSPSTGAQQTPCLQVVRNIKSRSAPKPLPIQQQRNGDHSYSRHKFLQNRKLTISGLSTCFGEPTFQTISPPIEQFENRM